MQKTLDEHRFVIEALGERNSEEASRAMQDHLVNAEGALLESYEAGEVEEPNEENSTN